MEDPSGGVSSKSYEGVLRYHERTKHHFRRFAKSLGYLDWQNQPHPFRFYEGVPVISLPLLERDLSAGHLDLYRRSDHDAKPFSIENIGGFLELSLALSAWKAAAGNQWALRINPSSGNLHPTECHLVLLENSSSRAGVYHYNPLQHALELRAPVPATLARQVWRHFAEDGFLVGLSSIFLRESWKYGERAFRYCNHDVGHALACLSFSANLQGWKIKCLNTLSDEEIAAVLGFDRVTWREQEEEYPEVLCFVYRSRTAQIARALSAEIINGFSLLPFAGAPNALSEKRTRWEVIDEIAAWTRKPTTVEQKYLYGQTALQLEPVLPVKASRLIRQRRSAVSFSGGGALEKSQFLAMLDKTIPRNDHAPFDVELGNPSVHLLLFVHAVRGLSPGLYCFLRDPADMAEVKALSRNDLLWQRVAEGIDLFLLEQGDFRRTAGRVSCDQEIAGSGLFSLGMISKFRQILEREPYRYRHLFWECGMVGQVFYLEAEAHGLRGTGIGCFYDDAVHDLLRLTGDRYQSLYHFTVGDPVEDARLMTYPPYAHLK